ncbi:MAG: ester cyclase [Chloroflexi bacterium]|nr:ester cyclase [Chloroflexota bacterium]
MSTEQNKATLRRFYEEVFNQGKYSVLDEICVPNYVSHSPGNPPGIPNNRDGLRQIIMMYRNAVPDIHFTIEDIMAEGDKVVCRWSSTGTHKGELLGIPATNKRATVTGTDITRCENGKLAEGWGVFDQLGLLQQLGVIPMGEQAAKQAAEMKAQATKRGPMEQRPPM